jgi:hypothetical protein
MIKNKKMKRILRKIYLYSEYIINLIFILYFLIYSICTLFRISVIYNYIFILLLGLFLGYRFAVKSYNYLKNGKNK